MRRGFSGSARAPGSSATTATGSNSSLFPGSPGRPARNSGIYPVTISRSGAILGRDDRPWSFKFSREAETYTAYDLSPEVPDGLSDDIVMAVQEDRQGRLWIGTRSRGLLRFDPATGSTWRAPSVRAPRLWGTSSPTGTARSGSARSTPACSGSIPRPARPAISDPRPAIPAASAAIASGPSSKTARGPSGSGRRTAASTVSIPTRRTSPGSTETGTGRTISPARRSRPSRRTPPAGSGWARSRTGCACSTAQREDRSRSGTTPRTPSPWATTVSPRSRGTRRGSFGSGTVRGGLNKCLAGRAKFEHYKRNASDPRKPRPQRRPGPVDGAARDPLGGHESGTARKDRRSDPPGDPIWARIRGRARVRRRGDPGRPGRSLGTALDRDGVLRPGKTGPGVRTDRRATATIPANRTAYSNNRVNALLADGGPAGRALDRHAARSETGSTRQQVVGRALTTPGIRRASATTSSRPSRRTEPAISGSAREAA
ncbi:MAG: hypothetical protein MZV63_13595 [Marinilabiliales bacterium]|nr:hypothetical protein [Marinilabiliales bacterium]